MLPHNLNPPPSPTIFLDLSMKPRKQLKLCMEEILSYRPSLEVLSFEGMPGWEVWSTNGRSTTGVVRDVVFPCLKELRIKDCPSLVEFSFKGDKVFPCLKELRIIKFYSLVEFSFEGDEVFPCLKVLHIGDCPISVDELPSLRVLRIDECGDGVLRSVVRAAPSVTESTDVMKYDICGNQKKQASNKVLVNLRKLKVYDCKNLVSLGEKDEEDEYKYGSNFLSSLSSLQKGGGQKRKSVTIKYCKKLLLLKEELGEEGEMNMDKSMPISDHPNVVGFGGNFIHLTSLTDLIIRDCPNMDVPTDGLWPPNLCDFTIGILGIEDEDQALMLLTSLSSSYENFMETLLYGRESLTIEDVLATLNSRELKKRTECTKEEARDGLYVRGRSGHSGKAHFGGSLRFKLRGETGKLKCFICHSESHLKRDCLKKKSSRRRGWALWVAQNDEMTELVMDSGGSYHMTHRRDFLYDFKVVDRGSVQLGVNRTCTIKETGKVKIQLHDGSSFILDVRSPWRQDEKRVWFEVELQRAQRDRKAKVFQVSNDDAAVAQRRLEDKQLEEKTNTDCLVKEQEKVHLGIMVRANIMVTGVHVQEGAEGYVAEKKKVKESMKANLGKLLKYNAWSTRSSPVRGSRKRY
ncbi:zinc finger, CCHC-type containing protein [Tanacetum coccineum]